LKYQPTRKARTARR